MTRCRNTSVTILVLAAVSATLTACGSTSKRVAIVPQQAHQDFAYAYQLPVDPNHPENGQWSTLVRMRPVTVGYRLRGIFPHEWVVVAVKPLPQDGQHAAVRGWRGKQNPIWHGKLVLRRAD